MSLSIFDMYSIGIGPSSSHTVGPMRAAKRFIDTFKNDLPQTARVQIDLYGSLALTGKGHGTDMAVKMGLQGETPEGIDPNGVPQMCDKIRQESVINLLKTHKIPFHEEKDLIFHYDKALPKHANGMTFTLFDRTGKVLNSDTYYSVGGGFVVDDEAMDKNSLDKPANKVVPFDFHDAATLIQHCHEQDTDIAGIMMLNELTWRSEHEVRKGLLHIWDVMNGCIRAGCDHPGVLPGGLKVKRRAPELIKLVQKKHELHREDFFNALNAWALAVNEENAAGGRVVTAPTNGAAGIIPAALKYYVTYGPDATDDGIVEFLLTAGAIGILYKLGASISAAEMGCQGEVGVACSMAAAGLCAVWGGTVAQVENAAEIGMEHHLGLTCDPINGLVQIPCIERNTMGVVQAVNAAKLALAGDGEHIVSLDEVIDSMRKTGEDMMVKYKETSQGGLAISVKLPNC